MGNLRRQGLVAKNAGWFAPETKVANRVPNSANMLDLVPVDTCSDLYNRMDVDLLDKVVHWFELADRQNEVREQIDALIEQGDDAYQPARPDLDGISTRLHLDMENIRRQISDVLLPEGIENGTRDPDMRSREVHRSVTWLMLEEWHKAPLTRMVIEGIAIQRSENE